MSDRNKRVPPRPRANFHAGRAGRSWVDKETGAKITVGKGECGEWRMWDQPLERARDAWRTTAIVFGVWLMFALFVLVLVVIQHG